LTSMLASMMVQFVRQNLFIINRYLFYKIWTCNTPNIEPYLV